MHKWGDKCSSKKIKESETTQKYSSKPVKKPKPSRVPKRTQICLKIYFWKTKNNSFKIASRSTQSRHASTKKKKKNGYKCNSVKNWPKKRKSTRRRRIGWIHSKLLNTCNKRTLEWKRSSIFITKANRETSRVPGDPATLGARWLPSCDPMRTSLSRLAISKKVAWAVSMAAQVTSGKLWKDIQASTWIFKNKTTKAWMRDAITACQSRKHIRRVAMWISWHQRMIKI